MLPACWRGFSTQYSDSNKSMIRNRLLKSFLKRPKKIDERISILQKCDVFWIIILAYDHIMEYVSQIPTEKRKTVLLKFASPPEFSFKLSFGNKPGVQILLPYMVIKLFIFRRRVDWNKAANLRRRTDTTG